MAESCKMTMKLLIISKSRYGPPQNPGQDPLPRWCYLGRETNGGGIYRPIPLQSLGTHNEKDFFWPQNHFNFKVGETHEFEFNPSQDQSMIPLPHRNDDIQVTHKRHVKDDGVLNRAGIFEMLKINASETINKALGFEGKIPRSNNGRHYIEVNKNCSSVGIYKYTDDEDDEVLQIIELGRPFNGRENFDPKRCFVKEVGVLRSAESESDQD